MKRRTFLKNTIPVATMLPAMINGYSVKAFNGSSLLDAVMLPQADTDKVLVIVQLSGGNDGLNTVIPVSDYSNYFNARSNIAIPEKKILKLAGYLQTGLHPAMAGFQNLFNEGKLTIIQAVGYPSPSFSHFRATDIWMSASDSRASLNTGWSGRYLNGEYPNYPNGYPSSSMSDPLAIQIGSVTSLTCQGPLTNMGISITNPETFYNLIDGIQDTVPNTRSGHELTYLRQVAAQTNKYAQRVRDAAKTVSRQVDYPSGNYLADQLKIVARLIKGGLKTRVYMVNYGGFDTHSLQVTNTDTTKGAHANLLSNVSGAIKAFMDDVYFLNIENRVLGMTFSEFGRRIKSNASGGTDHGAAAPMFVFGKYVNPTILGNNPVLPRYTSLNDNIPFQYDFRSVYASILQKWFCVSETDLKTIIMNNYQSLDIANNPGCPSSRPPIDGDLLISNYPNPFVNSTTIQFKSSGGHTLIQIIDSAGQVLQTILEQNYTTPGMHKVLFNADILPTGLYYARLQNGQVQQVRPMLKVK